MVEAFGDDGPAPGKRRSRPFFKAKRPSCSRFALPRQKKRIFLVPPHPLCLAPFYTSADVHVEARFVLSNLGNTAVIVELLVDPWNEFVRYRPNITVGEDEVAIDFSGYDKFFAGPRTDALRAPSPQKTSKSSRSILRRFRTFRPQPPPIQIKTAYSIVRSTFKTDRLSPMELCHVMYPA